MTGRIKRWLPPSIWPFLAGDLAARSGERTTTGSYPRQPEQTPGYGRYKAAIRTSWPPPLARLPDKRLELYWRKRSDRPRKVPVQVPVNRYAQPDPGSQHQRSIPYAPIGYESGSQPDGRQEIKTPLTSGGAHRYNSIKLWSAVQRARTHREPRPRAARSRISGRFGPGNTQAIFCCWPSRWINKSIVLPGSASWRLEAGLSLIFLSG